MKKILILCVVSISGMAFSQVNAILPENVTTLSGDASPFLDASSNYDPEIVGNNVGKGLVFPQVDLTKFQFNLDNPVPGAVLPTYYDGMVVYNIGSGELGSKGVAYDQASMGKKVSVEPGFYYFSNPNGRTNSNVEEGQWLPIGSGDTAASSANRKIVDVTFSGTYAKIPDNTFASGDEIVNAYLLKQDTGEKVGSVKIERNTQRPGLTGDYVFSSNGPLYTTLNGNYKLVVDIKK